MRNIISSLCLVLMLCISVLPMSAQQVKANKFE